MECTILVATDAYGMGIDNPDILLVIQWDIPISFDAMIQRMGRAGRKGGNAIFVLLTPKWSNVKDQKEIDDQVAGRFPSADTSHTLSNLNRPKSLLQPSPLSQNTTAAEEDLDIESIAGSDEEFDDDEDLLEALLNIEADEQQKRTKEVKRNNKSDADKRAKLPDEIFDYIHTVKCRRLFSLAWYGDVTYALEEGIAKPLPELCCNGPGCKSTMPEIFNREPFVDTTPIKVTESDREWMAFCTSELRKWRKNTSLQLWKSEGLTGEELHLMPDNLIIPDSCLLALAKHGSELALAISSEKLREFLQPWEGVDEYLEELFTLIKRSSPQISSSTNFGPSRAERKETLKAARTSKKLKYMDDLVVAEAAKMTALRDSWLVSQGKSSPGTTLRMKQAANQKKKEKKRLEKRQEKSKASDIRRLAVENRQAEVGHFQDVLSDPPDAPTDPLNETHPLLPPTAHLTRVQLMTESQPLVTATAGQVLQGIRKKKSAIALAAAARLPRRGTLAQPTTPLVQMELICPGSKRKVRVTANAIENTPTKRMKVSQHDPV